MPLRRWINDRQPGGNHEDSVSSSVSSCDELRIWSYRSSRPHAQATPKAYVVTEIEVINQEAQNAYLPKVGEVIKSTGGTYLARGGKIVALEGGDAPKRLTIVVYDSLQKAQDSRS